MPAGYDISASNASSANSATGAAQFGDNGHVSFFGTGGSVGFSTSTVLLIVGGLVAVWFFFLRDKGKKK